MITKASFRERPNRALLNRIHDFTELLKKNGKKLRIGRGNWQNQIVLGEDFTERDYYGSNIMYVSRNHAFVEKNRRNFVLSDNDSTNGTYILRDGERINLISHTRYCLLPNDQVYFGEYGPLIYEEKVISQQDQLHSSQ